MNKHTLFNPFTGLYNATLLGGEFSNCHSQGLTPEEALVSLKIRINQLRRNLND